MFRKSTRALRFAFFIFLAVPVSTSAQDVRPANRLASAKSQVARDDLDAAEKTVWIVLSSDPNSQEALEVLGTIRERQQRFAEAEALFRRSLQLDPNSVEVQEKLGSVLLAQNRPEEAAEVFRRALAGVPNNVMLKVDLARAYVGGQKFSEAAGILNGIPEERLPKSAVPVNAAILVGTGRTSEAAALAARATDSTALDLAEVFVNARQPELALKAIARLEGTPKGSVKLFYLKGTAQGLTGDFAGATRSFNRALALAPDSIFTLIALADLNAASKRYPESVSVLERARAADPNSIPVLRRLIEQALNANLQGLVEQTAYLLERKSSLPEDQYLSAAALLQEHEYEAAKRILTGYVAQRPQDSRAFLGLGLSYLNLQHYPEARKAFARALELDPNLMEAQYLMGVLLNKEGDTQGALALFEHVIQVQPKHAKALLDAGSLYLQAGDLEKSKLLLDAAESADATDSNTQYQLSLLYNRLGNADEARKHIDQFRSLKQNKGGTSQASQ